MRTKNEIEKLNRFYDESIQKKDSEISDLQAKVDEAIVLQELLGTQEKEVYSLLQEETTIKKLKSEALRGKMGVLEVENGSIKSINNDLITKIKELEQDRDRVAKSLAETEELVFIYFIFFIKFFSF